MARNWYVTEVNRGSINMARLQARLNEMREQGYGLAHIFEQKENTIIVFEFVGVPPQSEAQTQA